MTCPSSPPPDDLPRLGRPRGFDRDEALAAIIATFRRKGYEAASMAELCEASNLSRSSFYGCFGSKREALLEAVRSYAEAGLAQTRALIEAAPTPRDGALTALDAMAGAPLPAGGCFVVNCVTELAQADPEAAAILRRHLDRTGALLAQTLRPAAPATARPLADALLSLSVGALTLRKAGLGDPAATRAAAAALIDAALTEDPEIQAARPGD